MSQAYTAKSLKINKKYLTLFKKNKYNNFIKLKKGLALSTHTKKEA